MSKLTLSMELRLTQISLALDLALKEGNKEMLEVIRKNADKLRKEYLHTTHSAHIEVRKRCEEMLKQINNYKG